MPKILVIDDDDGIRDCIVESLSFIKCKALEAGNGSKGIEIFKKELPGIVIVDARLPDISGFEVIKKIKSIETNVKIFIMSGDAAIEETAEEEAVIVDGFIAKPINVNSILSLVLDLTK